VFPDSVRSSKRPVLAVAVLCAISAAMAAEPHRWSSRTCPPYCSPNFGYNPTTWRSWPTICEPSVQPAPALKKVEPEAAPLPSEEPTETKKPAKPAKPDAMLPAPQPPKKAGEPKDKSAPKQESLLDTVPSNSPYKSWNPILDATSNARRP
jgi:hypothetical protein